MHGVLTVKVAAKGERLCYNSEFFLDSFGKVFDLLDSDFTKCRRDISLGTNRCFDMTSENSIAVICETFAPRASKGATRRGLPK